MKFTVNSLELQRALAKVSGVLPSKSTMPILETMLLSVSGGILTVTGTDLDTSLTVSLGVSNGSDGTVAVPGRRFADTVRALPDVALTFDADTGNQRMTLKTSTGTYSLTGESAAEFPGHAEFKGSNDFSIDTTLLKRLIHQTAFAVSGDELRPAMMGVLLQSKGDDLRAVSTDGHRLVRYTITLPKRTVLAKDIIVPVKALNLVSKSLDGKECRVSVSDTHVRFQADSTVVVSRLIDEAYPNYESVIPQDNNRVMSVSRESMISSLRRVGLYASATTHQIRFGVAEGILTVAAQDIDFGGEAKETMPCEYDGEPLEIGFNATYVTDILAHLDADKATFKFSGPTRAGIVVPDAPKENEEVLMLVMPVRLTA